MHHDILLYQPVGTESLGSSAVCDVQGQFRSGKLLTLQAHPEFNGEIMRQLLEVSDDLGFEDRTLWEHAMKRSQVPHDGELVAEVAINFVMGSVY